MFIRKKTLQKLINQSHSEGVAVGYTLGYKLGQIKRGNRNLCGLPVTKLDFQLEEILKGFDNDTKVS